jgi:hypothetical protein
MKSRNFYLAILMTIGILAGAIAVAAQPPSSWAVGTFIGRNPNTGHRIRLVIARNGDVTARVERNTNYGTLRKDRMTINGETSRLKKTNNGFRTINDSNGEIIEYVRGNSGWNEGNNDWNDDNNQGGGRVPDWAVGTFYGTNPNTGGAIQLTIQSNGMVRVNMQGSYLEGSMNRETLTINGESSRVRKESGGGISTRHNRTGETIYYSKTAGGNNNNGNWDNGQQSGKVPSWAVGTFYATNPQNGQLIELTIGSDGRATVSFGGGSYAYGTVYKETLTINGETATLKRTRNGLATVKNSNGERIDYTRR